MKDHGWHEGALEGVTEVSRDHQQVWESLPWLANGTAEDPVRRRAEAHLAVCADCRRELEAQQRMRQLLNEAPPITEVDAESGWQRLLERLDAPLADQQLVASGAATRRDGRRLTMALAAAVVVQAIGLGVLGLHLAFEDGAGTYRMLTRQPSPPGGRPLLQVVPDASLAMADWQRILKENNLRVVDGPNQAGSYSLAFDGVVSSETADALVNALRATRGVRLAELIAQAR